MEAVELFEHAAAIGPSLAAKGAFRALMRKIVECCFKLKHFLNLAIRFDGRACHSLASLCCIASMLLMR